MRGEKDAFLSVAEMADLLFNDTSPSLCYASHRLLNEDRTYFKQVGRLPPKFAARSDTEVQAIKGRQAAELKVPLCDYKSCHIDGHAKVWKVYACNCLLL